MKSARQTMILELIDQYDIDTQDELASMLKARGLKVTQATVSRDIKELRLIKVLSDDGAYKYATVDKAEADLKDRFINIFAHSVLSMAATGNLVVIKTIPGTASAAAEAIDSMRMDEVVGTIAGDNSVIVFNVDKKTGLLTKNFCLPVSGEYPKDADIFPNNKFIVSLNHESNEMTFFHVDLEAGTMIMNGPAMSVEVPNRILFHKLS